MVQFPTYFPIGDGLISLSKYCMMILYIQTWNQGSLTSLVVLSQFHRVTFLGRKTISSSSLGDSFEAGRSELDGAKIFPGSHRLFKPGSSPPEQFGCEGPEENCFEKKHMRTVFFKYFFLGCLHMFALLLWNMRWFVFFLRLWRIILKCCATRKV